MCCVDILQVREAQRPDIRRHFCIPGTVTNQQEECQSIQVSDNAHTHARTHTHTHTTTTMSVLLVVSTLIHRYVHVCIHKYYFVYTFILQYTTKTSKHSVHPLYIHVPPLFCVVTYIRRLAGGQTIQMVTALILQMAQCIVVNPASEDPLQKVVAENEKEMSAGAKQVSMQACR